METMRIHVMRMERGKALVRAVSRRKVGRQPEAVILVSVRLPPGASLREARDVALKYLDPA